MSDIITSIDPCGVVTVTLNRPEIHNAFNDTVIADLTGIFQRLGNDPAVRVIVLRGAGKSFSAGGDLNWMRRMASYSREENVADAMGLATMLRTLNECPKPTLAVIHGHCFAGAVGLVAACDIAIAADAVQFALTEVRLGLIPATIGPYVVAAMGARACRRYFLTAERFGAVEAHQLGLVHEVVGPDDLDAATKRHIANLLAGGPLALAAAKGLIRAVDGPVTDAMVADTAARIADARAGDEGREGLASFFDKRKPGWVK
ncbi:enoyl-CoA hydratase/isomerase family protein [Niveispirillum sp. SYP-B3756]|uniref:enoyl-CoA hydratase/isomerase family protein n=1 Tax=Niveispirillum sp. SYP-B3756 TaxID=2662178 RepID=UPI0012918B0D|nr:enoyl-CoA hydratase/isomerase family protein [Niveispirillum sp. SYP-B3756]MQP66287.1 enoyl-CoA hydratase/isomerase family protein [Niveispirillum sp. SYP-B3756]